jgi:predicted enzyme related to lactoylglutathione lyase
MTMKLTSVQVDDLEEAPRFHTEVLGIVKRADYSEGPFRWLAAASPDDPELRPALDDSPAAKAYQQAMFQQGQRPVMFNTDDVRADYERMKSNGAEFTLPPADVTGAKTAILNDTCGKLPQATQLLRRLRRRFSR